ncbi:MAG: hypothetical protein J6A75_08690 [Lachnospiraceae bacterium]|nr:hypothetical protein [Lachnospiraceae bacterium]
MKKLTKITVFLIALGFVFIFGNNFTVKATSFEECNITSVNQISEFDNISAMYVQKASAAEGDEQGVTNYFKFTLAEDSWVKFTGSYSMNQHDGGQTHVDIYADAMLSNEKGEYGWGYWEYDEVFSGFLKAGTYYGVINTKQANYSDFVANVNVVAGAIPVSKIFDVQITTPANKKYATVVLPDVLGSSVRCVQYRSGAVNLENAYSNTYWKYHIMDDIYDGGDDNVQFINIANNSYSFKVIKNGQYTIMLMDTEGGRYSVVVSVKEIDTKKPTVKGVKNKKTYKKAVKIKFYDNGSGIQSAKLNGKKIKSGKKVSKSGSYKLVVTDKAKNKTTIKFKIKKK